VLQRASAAVIAEVAVEEGMRPLRIDGIEKAIEGSTSLDEILRVTGGEG